MLEAAIDFIITLAPIWAPVVLFFIFVQVWMHYINMKFVSGIKWTMLEVKIPKDVYKSPAAMELVLNSLHQPGGVGTWIDRYWKGKVKQWFSLELVSIEGKIFFFIRTPEFFKDLLESQIYAQYPSAEINEVDDYTNYVPLYEDDNDWSVWGAEMKLVKPDPYPIKTYVDYGMDRDVGLEDYQKIDPMTSTLEFLGSLGKGEQAWIQILVKADDPRFDKGGGWFSNKGSWVDEAEAEIEKIIEKGKIKSDEEKPSTTINLTKGQQQTMEAIEKSVSKLGFDCGIRIMYLAKGDSFRPINIAGLVGSFKQYSSKSLNGFKPAWVTDFDHPWQDPTGHRKERLKSEILKAYKRRSFFHPPHKRKDVFVLNTEELATIYHFPGQVSETPSFERIISRKSEPPANLPT